MKEQDGNIKYYTQEEVNNLMYNLFAKTAKQPLLDSSGKRGSSLSSQKFSKEKIIEYLKDPQRNEKNIRDASVYMYNNSSHYKRLILNYALMPNWSYVIEPYKYNLLKEKKNEGFLKQYNKVCQIVENMQLKHELQKVAITGFREDVFYGICWETSDSFFIQKINPDICQLSSIEDGVYNFAVDMSKIKEEELILYPEEFTKMWNEYKRSGNKVQEVPSNISACFKVNEDLPYPLPIFAGTMALLHDIEDYKAIIKAKAEVNNYKLINMKMPLKDGQYEIDWDEHMRYYNILTQNVPEGVGVSLSPTNLDTIDFEKNNALSDTNEVFKAEEQFWSSTGTSHLLFGGGSKNSSGSIKLSLISDEAIAIGFINQCERWLNRRLKNISGSIKFKVNLLPVTKYNQEDYLKMIKEASTYGLPVKSRYAALLGIQPLDLVSNTYLENDVLELPDILIPMKSTHTQSSEDSIGRPTNEEIGKALTDSGEQTQEDGLNEDR